VGDAGAKLVSADILELHRRKRVVDMVLKLEKDGEVYYRHIELQARPDPDMALRCFEYNRLMFLQTGLPVLTTVIDLFPPGPAEESVFRVKLFGHDVIYFRFNVVSLWKMEAEDVLASRAPGLLALVPLMAGGQELRMIERANRAMEEAGSPEEILNAQGVLLALAGSYYNYEVLESLVGRDRMMRSSVVEHFMAEGREEGRAEGRVEAERELCLDMLLEFHPGLVKAATPAVQACSDADTLKQWVLLAPKIRDDAEFARLIGLNP